MGYREDTDVQNDDVCEEVEQNDDEQDDGPSYPFLLLLRPVVAGARSFLEPQWRPLWQCLILLRLLDR